MKRRQLLQLLAASPLTFGFLRSLEAAAPPKRLVIIMQNNGTQQASFWPKDTSLSSPILDDLFRGNTLRKKTTIVKGVFVPPDQNGTNANPHDIGFARLFTGAKLLNQGGQPWGGGASIDQIIARKLNVETLALAVHASYTEPMPKPGADHRRSFSYLAPGRLKQPQIDPRQAFDALFRPADWSPRKTNVLDAVSGNLREVQARLSGYEREKLDHHLGAIERLQRRLASDTVRAGARPPAFDPIDLIASDAQIPALVDHMIDLAASALICGATQITTVQLGFGGGKWRFAWEGIDKDAHEHVAHHDTSDAGSSAENTEHVVRINRFYARAVARLASQLDAVPESGGTMLDNTLIVWGNELGRGDHSLDNVPIVFVGGGARRGLIDEGPQIFNRIGCTIGNYFDLALDGFGDEPLCGAMDL